MSAERPPLSPTEFDSFTSDYDASLAEGLSVSGKDKDFFARGRVQWLSICLRKAGTNPRNILDFGCGVGSSFDLLLGLSAEAGLLGTDASALSLSVARERHPSARAQLCLAADFTERNTMDGRSVTAFITISHWLTVPTQSRVSFRLFDRVGCSRFGRITRGIPAPVT